MKSHLIRALAVLLALVTLQAPAAERKPLPKELPPFSEAKPPPVPKVLESKTPEGLTVWLVPREGLPKVSAVLAVRGGSAADPKGKEGLSELLASTLKEGTSRRTSQGIAEALQAVGGTMWASADNDALYVGAEGLSSGVETVIDVMADIARNSSFPAQEVELAKANALQQLQVKASSSRFLADKVFSAAIYGKHPYRTVSAEPATISSATPAVLKKEFARRFRPTNTLLVIVGAFEPESVSRFVAKSFEGWKGSGAALPETPPLPAPKGREILFVSRPGSVQSSIMVGRFAPHPSEPGYFPALVANSVFGSPFVGRLMENIREDKGYSYTPRSSLVTLQRGGVLQVRVHVRNEVTAAALMEVLYELDRLGATDVSAEDLTAAQRFTTGTWLLLTQQLGMTPYTIASNWVVGLPPEYLGEYVSKLNAVTADQVRDAGRKLFASGRQLIVVVGDEKVKADLEQFGPVKELKP